ncbi:hypothetical protein KL907_000601 [Ogataea polymorpha]|nr:hypothetical protein KL937_000569 [Ogataea polymorpha]KAG7912399.1 hypothetical protein KL907_000601 [Ogataea polymorpha]KAG7919015.1 hypothetical protein KL927_001144 [Ogataea polymorpha]KAG7939628.1 hypothetical protein KL904_000566 [Ogataea polymorpha]
MSGSWVYIELEARERSSVGANVDITDWLESLWRSSRRYILPMRLSSNKYSSRDVMVLRVMHSIVPQMALHSADIRIVQPHHSRCGMNRMRSTRKDSRDSRKVGRDHRSTVSRNLEELEKRGLSSSSVSRPKTPNL